MFFTENISSSELIDILYNCIKKKIIPTIMSNTISIVFFKISIGISITFHKAFDCFNPSYNI